MLGTGVAGINKKGDWVWMRLTYHISTRSQPCYKRKRQGARQQIRPLALPGATGNIPHSGQRAEPSTTGLSTWSLLRLVAVWLGLDPSTPALLTLLLSWYGMAGDVVFHLLPLHAQGLDKWLNYQLTRAGRDSISVRCVRKATCTGRSHTEWTEEPHARTHIYCLARQ